MTKTSRPFRNRNRRQTWAWPRTSSASRNRLPARRWRGPTWPRCRRGCRPTPAPARPSTSDQRPSESCPVPFAAQSDPQAFAEWHWQQPLRVLVDLLGRDGALGDDRDALSTKTLADKILDLVGRSIWLDEHEGSSPAARAFNLQIRHPSVRRSDDDGCFLLHRWCPLLVVRNGGRSCHANISDQPSAGRGMPSDLTECGRDFTRTPQLAWEPAQTLTHHGTTRLWCSSRPPHSTPELRSLAPKQSSSTTCTSELCAQSRPTSSLCACGAVCTSCWLRLRSRVFHEAGRPRCVQTNFKQIAAFVANTLNVMPEHWKVWGNGNSSNLHRRPSLNEAKNVPLKILATVHAGIATFMAGTLNVTTKATNRTKRYWGDGPFVQLSVSTFALMKTLPYPSCWPCTHRPHERR